MSTASTLPAQVVYLETCLPDYHQGFGGPTYAVYPYQRTWQVRDELLRQVHGEELFLPDGESAPEEAYDELEASVRELFSGLNHQCLWQRPEPGNRLDDMDVTPLSYFGVLWGRWAEQERPTPPQERWTEVPPVGTVVEYAGNLEGELHPLDDWRPGDRIEVIAVREDIEGGALPVLWNPRTCTASGLVVRYCGEYTMRIVKENGNGNGKNHR